MKESSYVIQGVNIHIHCDQRLHQFMSKTFNFFYKGEVRPEKQPVLFDLSITEEPPPLPTNAVQAIKGLYVTCYRNGSDIYFIAKDDSTIHLKPSLRKAKGFLRKEVMNNSIVLFSLVTAPFSEILKYDRFYSLHAAALYNDNNGDGYLISGESGSGKTTLSLCLVSEGFKYVSDDAVLLEETNEDIIVHSLFNTFNIDRDLGERFPDVVEEKNLPLQKEAKVSVNVSKSFPGSFISQLRPNTIIFPRITSNEKSQIYPLGQIEIYRRLLKQIVLAAEKEVSREQLKAIGNLVKQARGFELLSGRDIYGNPKKVVNIINELNS